MSMSMLIAQNLLEEVEALAVRWADIAAPIFGDSSKKFVDAEGFGTGFITRCRGDFYFYTADHVVADFAKYQACVANVFGKAMEVGDLAFQRDGRRDIAYAKLSDDDFSRIGVASVKFFDLERDWCQWNSTGVHVVTGYPASQNLLKLRFNSVTRRGLNLFCTPASSHPRTALPEYLALSYFHKQLKAADGSKFNALKLNGMSGGPCMEVMALHAAGHTQYAFRAVGVVSELHASDRVILAVPLGEGPTLRTLS